MILYIGNMLSKHGKSVTVIEKLSQKLSLRYQVSTASGRKNPLCRLVEMLWLILSNRGRCKLVLIDTYSTSAFWYAYLSARLCSLLQIPFIPLLHGGNLPDRYEVNGSKLKWYLLNAEQIVSPSVYLKEFFESRGFFIQLIPNAIDIEHYNFEARCSLPPRILWVRAFDMIYNPLMAIEMLRHLRQTHPKAQLCMVGGELDKDLLASVRERIHDYQMDDNVTITGPLPKRDWLLLSERFCIFINTSNVDNLPVSILEAAALGLSIVSTNVGGIPYLLTQNETALLVPKDDALSMAKAIEYLIDNPEHRLRMRIAARTKAESFDWDKVKNDWHRVLDPLIN